MALLEKSDGEPKFESRWLSDLLERFRKWCVKYARGRFRVVEASPNHFVARCITSREIKFSSVKSNKFELEVDARDVLERALEEAEEQGLTVAEAGWIAKFREWLGLYDGFVPLQLKNVESVEVRSGRSSVSIENIEGRLADNADIYVSEIPIHGAHTKAITIEARDGGKKSVRVKLSWVPAGE